MSGAVSLGCAGILLERNARAVLLSGPMVQIPAPGSLAIVWEMDATFPRGTVTLSKDGQDRTIAARRIGDHRYEARVDGLAPGARVEYRVFDLGLAGHKKLMAGPFPAAAAAPRGQAFRFIAFGDSGNGSNAQTDLAHRMADEKPDVVIHAGDLVYPAGEPRDYRDNFYDPNAVLIRSVPFMASLGNHDCATDAGRPLLRQFVLPENGPPGLPVERNYWFDFGDARFVALDTNPVIEAASRPATSQRSGESAAPSADESAVGGEITMEQMKTVVAPWLRSVLTDCDAKWKFVYFHHPFYTNGPHRPEMQQYVKDAFLAVFDEAGVDVVFAGHNHLYERTAPMRGDKIVPEGEGTMYITTGAGGVSRYPVGEPKPDYIRYYNNSVFSYTRVDLSAYRFEMKQIDEQGRVIDQFAIDKKPGASSWLSN